MRINFLKVFIVVIAVVLLTSVSTRASEMDERIESSIKQSYVFKTYLNDDAIQTQSKDGVVTLSGTVKEESHKALAKETVANLPEVKSVENQLEFTGARIAENSDQWINIQVKNSLLLNHDLSGIKIQVFVTDGIVTLKGDAESQVQKDLAGAYAKDVEGVQDVKNEMNVSKVLNESKKTMSEKVDDASVTSQVKMAFLSHQSTSAFKTGVSTDNGVVILSGKATSTAGKDMATKVASEINGVTRVINNMTIGD